MVLPRSIRLSRQQEKRAAVDLDGRRTPGSGNQWHSPGDVCTEHALVECKTTESKSYTLKVKDLLKIETEAVMKRKEPVFQIEFHGTPRRSYAIIPWPRYLELLSLEGETDAS